MGDVPVEARGEIDSLRAVVEGPRPRPAHERLDGAHQVRPGGEIRRRHQHDGTLSAARGGHPLPPGARQGAENDIGHLEERGLSGAAGRAGLGVEERPTRRVHLDGADKARVVHRVRLDAPHEVDHAHDQEVVAVRAVGGNVERRRHLRVRALEVEEHLIPPDPQRQADADVASLRHQVPLEVVPELVVSVGNLPYQGAGLGFRVIQNVVERRPQEVRSVLFGEARDAQFRALERPEHRQYVPPVLVRNAAVPQEDPQDVFPHLVFGNEPGHRNDHPFLMLVDGGRRDGAGREPAHVRAMDEGDREADELAVVIDGTPAEDVEQMGDQAPALLRVVGEPDVAGPVGPADFDHGPEVLADPYPEPDVHGAGRHLSPGRHQGDDEILGFLDEDGMPAAGQQLAHLLHDPLEPAPEYFQQDGVGIRPGCRSFAHPAASA